MLEKDYISLQFTKIWEDSTFTLWMNPIKMISLKKNNDLNQEFFKLNIRILYRLMI